MKANISAPEINNLFQMPFATPGVPQYSHVTQEDFTATAQGILPQRGTHASRV
jgi:hypothetical protein